MELLEDIIPNVLYFLRDKADTKEITRTSVLSKAWLHAWQTCPRLRFHYHDFKHKEDFVAHVNRTLLRYQEEKIRIEELVLDCWFYRDSELLLNRWLEIAAERGVKKLELFCNSVPNNWATILKANLLEDLLLHGRLNSTTLPVIQSVSCHKLKRLYLDRVSLCETMFDNLISSCQWIEFLELRNCDGIVNFKVTKLGKLRELIIFGCRNLRTINISGRALGRLKLHCCPKGEELRELKVEAPNIFWFCYIGTVIPDPSFFADGSRNFHNKVTKLSPNRMCYCLWKKKGHRF